MTRAEAIELAQRKANDWGLPYRVLRFTDTHQKHAHTVEQSASYDSPRGMVLVEVFKPTIRPNSERAAL